MPLHPDTVALMIDTNPSQAPQFYLAIGHAITRWQQVEREVSAVFVKTSTCQHAQVASAIFYSPQDFVEKLKLVHHSARLSLDASEFDEWLKLRKRLIIASQLRNALAHFYATIEIPGVGVKVPMAIVQLSSSGAEIERGQVAFHPPGVRWILHPNSANPNEKFKDRHRSDTKKPMVAEDIVRAGNSFHSLMRDVEAFAARVAVIEAPVGT
jgi:hypothetical protein